MTFQCDVMSSKFEWYFKYNSLHRLPSRTKKTCWSGVVFASWQMVVLLSPVLDTHAHPTYAHRDTTLLASCPLCGAPAVASRRLLQCTSFLERQAEVRVRRIYKGQHLTPSTLFDGIPWPLRPPHHARRALPRGMHGAANVARAVDGGHAPPSASCPAPREVHSAPQSGCKC